MATFADLLTSRGLRRALRHWFETREMRGEIAGLSAADRDALFRDIAIDEASLEALEDGAHDTEGLDALLARLGVDPDHLRDDDVRLIALLRRECAMCSDWTRCAHDIAAGAVQGAAPSYCPNRTTIETLAIGRRPYPRVV